MLFNKGEKTRNNFFRILRAVWLSPELSRVELARLLAMDKATVSTVVSWMIEKNIIRETEKIDKDNRVGRKPIGLVINLHFGYIIGCEIQNDHIAMTASDLAYNKIISTYYSYKTDKDNLDYNFIHVLDDFISQKELKSRTPIGIGVAVSGIIDTKNQIINRSKPLNIVRESYDFHDRVINKLDLPLYIGNDANCCASGILAKYRNCGYKNFIFLYFYYRSQSDENPSDMRLGLGIGIVLNENLYSGEDGTVGEFRSHAWDGQGESQFSLTPDEIQHLKTDRVIQNKLCHEMAVNISLLVNTLNLKTVFIGGDVEYLPEDCRDIFLGEIKHNWPYSYSPSCEIKIMDHEEDLVSLFCGGHVPAAPFFRS
jgi:hypothetical protein